MCCDMEVMVHDVGATCTDTGVIWLRCVWCGRDIMCYECAWISKCCDVIWVWYGCGVGDIDVMWMWFNTKVKRCYMYVGLFGRYMRDTNMVRSDLNVRWYRSGVAWCGSVLISPPGIGGPSPSLVEKHRGNRMVERIPVVFAQILFSLRKRFRQLYIL